MMAGKRYSPKVLLRMPREAEVLEEQGKTMTQDVRQSGITEQTLRRWRKEYDGERRHRRSPSGVAIKSPPS
jgi:putative transposase